MFSELNDINSFQTMAIPWKIA